MQTSATKIVEYVGIFQIQFIVVTTLLRLVIARVYRVVVSEVRERAVGRVVLIPEKQLIAGFIDDAYSCICIDVEIVSYLYPSISPLSVGSFYPIVSCRQYRYRRSFFPGVFHSVYLISGRSEAETSISGIELIFDASCTMGVNSFSMVTARCSDFCCPFGLLPRTGSVRETGREYIGFSLCVGVCCGFKFFETDGYQFFDVIVGRVVVLQAQQVLPGFE